MFARPLSEPVVGIHQVANGLRLVNSLRRKDRLVWRQHVPHGLAEVRLGLVLVESVEKLFLASLVILLRVGREFGPQLVLVSRPRLRRWSNRGGSGRLIGRRSLACTVCVCRIASRRPVQCGGLGISGGSVGRECPVTFGESEPPGNRINA